MKTYDKNKFDNLITYSVYKMEFQDEFKPFIIEILKRRAAQFDFTEEQVKTDLDRLSKSLKSINCILLNIDDLGNYDSYIGVININSLYGCLPVSKSYMFSILVHELFHALANENGIDKMESFNIHTGQYNGSLLECLVERATYTLVYQNKTTNPYYNRNSVGYQEMIFALDMITATFGVPENELLGHAIQGRDKLIKYLTSKSNLDEHEVVDYLDRFEANLAVIHRNTITKDDLSDKGLTKGKNISLALGWMSVHCARVMSVIIARTPEEELTPERIEDLKYNYNKLITTIKSGTWIIRSYPGFSNKKFMEISEGELELYANTIAQTEYLLEYKKQNPDIEDLGMDEFWARHGLLGNPTEYKKTIDGHNILISDFKKGLPKRRTFKDRFKISQEVITRNQMPKDKAEGWDNSTINGFNLLLRRTMFRNILNRITRHKALPPGNEVQNIPKEIDNNTEKPSWNISEEQVSIINNNTSELIENLKQSPSQEDHLSQLGEK